MKNATLLLLLLALSAALSAACVTSQAQSKTERPALDVPPPPPRVIAPAPAPEPARLEPVEELPTGMRPSSPVRNRPQTTRDGKEPPKPDPKPEQPALEVQTPATPAASPPAPQLRIGESGDTNATSRQVRDSVDRTRKLLNSINYQQLTAARQKAYDDAKLFATQAEDAIKASNLVFAKELADKAERLAKELQSR